MHPVAARMLSLAGFALIVGGLVAAVTLLLLPLPTLTAGGSDIAWCGPGETSVSALQVRLDPGIVNTGSIPGQATASQTEQQTLIRVCSTVADNRITEAAAAAAITVALGIGISLVARRARAAPSGGYPQPWEAPPASP
jgi:hypothetical protein